MLYITNGYRFKTFYSSVLNFSKALSLKIIL